MILSNVSMSSISSVALSDGTIPVTNKLAMATETCPQGKFHVSYGDKLTMNDLKEFFDRVYVINLKRRPDRLRAFWGRLERYGWPFKEPQVYPAVEGDKVGVPPEFTQGGGAYGCRMSHLRILQDCLMDDIQSVLILEDDADITEGFPERVAAFLAHVPDDWEGLMLGGQHHAPPIQTDIAGVVRVRYAQRTHAYGARPSYMKALQRRWGNGTVHIDWMMRDWQHQRSVYAPDPWLIGQAGGRSDIRGAVKPPEWWVSGDKLPPGPVAVAIVERPALEEMIYWGFHPGMTRDDNGMDVGLKRVFADRWIDQYWIDTTWRERGEKPWPYEPKPDALCRWLELIQSESVGGLLPTVWVPDDWWQRGGMRDVLPQVVRAVWKGPVYEIRVERANDAYAALPAEIQERMMARVTLRRAPVVLLRCPAHMIRELHSHGFHPGYWRDKDTGLDMGLKRIFEKEPEEKRGEELRKWCDLLCKQADQDGLIVAAVHPQLTVAMLRQATDRQVVEIAVNTPDNLRRQLFGASCAS